MEVLYQLSIALTTWLQETYPQLLGFMSLISAMGEEEFFLIVLPAVYWTIDKRAGRQLGYLFLLSVLVNSILKGIIREPRPFWIEPDIQLGEGIGYGLPSGHVQHATVVFMLAAALLRRTWAWIVVLLYILLMAVSRVYLGVHFIHDNIAGFLTGLIILGLFIAWQVRLNDRFHRQILGRRLLVIVFVPLVLAIAYVGARLLIGPPNIDVPWGAFVPAAELGGFEGIVTAVASLLGFGVGMLLESSRIRFLVDGPLWQRVARFLLGIAVTVGIWAGLRAVFPAEPAIIALPLRFVRYLLLLLWVTYFAPWVFVRLRLASADPESEVRVTL